LKNVFDSGRQSSQTAPRPTSQVRIGNTRPTTVFGPRKDATRLRVSMPNRTVEVIRAQFFPWPFARAIHSHRPMPTPAEMIATMRRDLNAWSI